MPDRSEDQPRTAPMPRQRTDRPGLPGRPDGPAHHERLSKDSVPQRKYGPGTYGNDQFAAQHFEDIEAEVPKPEGITGHEQGHPDRPTTRPKDPRYGRTGEHGKG